MVFAILTASALPMTDVDYYRVNTSPVINDEPDDSPRPMRLPDAAKNGEGELMATGYVSFKIAGPAPQPSSSMPPTETRYSPAT